MASIFKWDVNDVAGLEAALAAKLSVSVAADTYLIKTGNPTLTGNLTVTGSIAAASGTFSSTITVGTGGPKIKNSSAEVQIRNNADSTYADLRVENLYANGSIIANRIHLPVGGPMLQASGTTLQLRDVTDSAFVSLQALNITATSTVSGGNVFATGALGINTNSASAHILWGAAGDLRLYRDAANILAQRNDANAQTLRVYGSYTDSVNYVRASLSASTTVITFAAETAGSGADNVNIELSPSGTGYVYTSKDMVADRFYSNGSDSWINLLGDNYLGNTTYFRSGGVSRATISGATGAITATTGTFTPSANGQEVIRLNQTNGTRSMTMGTYSAAVSYAGIWMGSATPSTSNYVLMSDGGTDAVLNAPAGALVFRIGNSTYAQINTTEILLVPQSSNKVVIRNGTNAQTLQVHGTYTDASTYVRASLSCSTTAVTLAAEDAAGTGNLNINLTPKGTGTVISTTASAAGDLTALKLVYGGSSAGNGVNLQFQPRGIGSAVLGQISSLGDFGPSGKMVFYTMAAVSGTPTLAARMILHGSLTDGTGGVSIGVDSDPGIGKLLVNNGITVNAGITATTGTFSGAVSFTGSAIINVLSNVPRLSVSSSTGGTALGTYAGQSIEPTNGLRVPGKVIIGTTGDDGSLLQVAGALTLGTSGILVGGTNLIEQRNSTNAQTLRVYGSYTDAANYVRASLSCSTAALTLAFESNTGDGDVVLTPKGTGTVLIGRTTALATGTVNAGKLQLYTGSGGALLVTEYVTTSSVGGTGHSLNTQYALGTAGSFSTSVTNVLNYYTVAPFGTGTNTGENINQYNQVKQTSGSAHTINTMIVQRNFFEYAGSSTIYGTIVLSEMYPALYGGSGNINNIIGLNGKLFFNAGYTGTLTNFKWIQLADITGVTASGVVYGIQSSISTAANKWNLYIDGTAQNYFAGGVSIGTTTATAAGRLLVNDQVSCSRIDLGAGGGNRQIERCGSISNDSVNGIVISATNTNWVELRNSTNAQTLRVNGSWTDASTYKRAALSCSTTALTLAFESNSGNGDVILTPKGTGIVSSAASIFTSGNFQGSVGTAIQWGTNAIRAYISAPSVGKLLISNTTNYNGVTLDANTTDTLKIRNGADNADGALTAGSGTFTTSVAVGAAKNKFIEYTGIPSWVQLVSSTGVANVALTAQVFLADSHMACNAIKTYYSENLLYLSTNKVEQYNSTSAQTFQLYGSRTDASTYSRASLSCSTTALTLAFESNSGDGNIVLTPKGTGSTISTKPFSAATNGAQAPTNVMLYVRETGASSSPDVWKGRIVAGGDNVAFIMGEYKNECWLGGHNAALNAWQRLKINPDGAAELHLGNSNGGGAGGAPILNISNSTSISTFAGPVVLKSYTVAGVPAATTAGQIIYVSNESGGAVPAFSDGTNWRRVTDRAIVS